MTRAEGASQRSADVEGVKSGAREAVNEYFKQRLFDVPGIRLYLEDLHDRGGEPRPTATPEIRVASTGAPMASRR